MARKAKRIERINDLLGTYQVLDSTIHLDPVEYGTHEQAARQAIRDLEKANPSLDALAAVYRLLDAALSQALNRDAELPWIVGAKKVSGEVGNKYPTKRLA